ncbi:lysozyme-like [Anticarsia gemmatalis]|uniref:lysozyme-like n=1 Tax=Anticarsia gemmatalis TaxID=129554 RepID=UPI003F776F09
MHKYMIVVLVVAALCAQSEAKVFTRCGLVQELRRQGFPEKELSEWICIIETESNRDSATAGGGYYGLFQIGQHWCSKTTSPGKACNVTCSDLTTDDITKASNCAKRIMKSQGFKGWATGARCEGKRLPDISDC